MKPDAYMPFYGNDLIQATERLSDAAFRAYVKAIWNYWSDTHATGLPDNDRMLYQICGKPDGWDEVKAEIFGGNGYFFLGEDEKWHQKRAGILHAEVMRNYGARCKQTEKARKSRRL